MERETIDVPAFIIDNPGSVEIDDAISIQDREGKLWVFIHIVDMTRFLNFNSVVDRIARFGTAFCCESHTDSK